MMVIYVEWDKLFRFGLAFVPFFVFGDKRKQFQVPYVPFSGKWDILAEFVAEFVPSVLDVAKYWFSGGSLQHVGDKKPSWKFSSSNLV